MLKKPSKCNLLTTQLTLVSFSHSHRIVALLVLQSYKREPTWCHSPSKTSSTSTSSPNDSMELGLTVWVFEKTLSCAFLFLLELRFISLLLRLPTRSQTDTAFVYLDEYSNIQMFDGDQSMRTILVKNNTIVRFTTHSFTQTNKQTNKLYWFCAYILICLIVENNNN